jgi:hypothetical protein
MAYSQEVQFISVILCMRFPDTAIDFSPACAVVI